MRPRALRGPEDDLAEETPSPAGDNEIAPRGRRAPVARANRAERALQARTARAERRRSGRPGPIRSTLTVMAVVGLVAAVGIPAYAAWQPPVETKTIQQLAEAGAQSLVVASDVDTANLERSSYSATTADEIKKQKAATARAAAASAAASSGSSVNVDVASIPVGSGALSWPTHSLTKLSDGWGARNGTHHGQDMLAPEMSPVYASADGVVSVSTDSGGAYGAYVKIEHVIDGVRVSTLYAHMTYGTRLVQAGDVVTRGQQIGSVGHTGYATANHVHFEVFVNGAKVPPMPWLGPYGS